jgi:phosphopantothenoylcysteine decarboxylase/phosphopantothenate--cysteine ligase
MYTQVHANFQSVDIAILSAAVADYKPKTTATSKIKKASPTLSLELEKTKDILASLGTIKSHQLLVGFALETNDEVANAIKKLKSKNLDLIVLNSLNDAGAGFGGTTNKVTLIDKNLVQTEFPLKSKAEVAADIMNELLKQFNA